MKLPLTGSALSEIPEKKTPVQRATTGLLEWIAVGMIVAVLPLFFALKYFTKSWVKSAILTFVIILSGWLIFTTWSTLGLYATLKRLKTEANKQKIDDEIIDSDQPRSSTAKQLGSTVEIVTDDLLNRPEDC